MALINFENYWIERYNRQGLLTVGNAPTIKGQDEEYNIKEDFIFSHCPTNLYTLDYGCGIGRYAKRFNNYYGYDITVRAIDLAKKLNPDKLFSYEAITTNFDLFFTATVLQHCGDSIVDNIFKRICTRSIMICLYENNTNEISEHVCGRSPEEYKKMIEKYAKIEEMKSYSHIVHGEQHSLTLIKINV